MVSESVCERLLRGIASLFAIACTIIVETIRLAWFVFVGICVISPIFCVFAYFLPWIKINLDVAVFNPSNYTMPIGNQTYEVDYYLNYYSVYFGQSQNDCDYGQNNTKIIVNNNSNGSDDSIQCSFVNELGQNSIFMTRQDAEETSKTMCRLLISQFVLSFVLMLLLCQKFTLNRAPCCMLLVYLGLVSTEVTLLVYFRRAFIPSLGINHQILALPDKVDFVYTKGFYFALVSCLREIITLCVIFVDPASSQRNKGGYAPIEVQLLKSVSHHFLIVILSLNNIQRSVIYNVELYKREPSEALEIILQQVSTSSLPVLVLVLSSLPSLNPFSPIVLCLPALAINPFCLITVMIGVYLLVLNYTTTLHNNNNTAWCFGHKSYKPITENFPFLIFFFTCYFALIHSIMPTIAKKSIKKSTSSNSNNNNQTSMEKVANNSNNTDTNNMSGSSSSSSSSSGRIDGGEISKIVNRITKKLNHIISSSESRKSTPPSSPSSTTNQQLENSTNNNNNNSTNLSFNNLKKFLNSSSLSSIKPYKQTNSSNNNNNNNSSESILLNLQQQQLKQTDSNNITTHSSSETTDYFPFLNLPEELIIEVSTFLDLKSLANLSTVSKDIARLVFNDVLFWRQKVQEIWTSAAPSTSMLHQLGVGSKFEWYQYYKMRHLMSQSGAVHSTLVRVKGTTPSARYQHTGAVVGNNIYYIGGQETQVRRFNDIFKFNTDTQRFSKVEIQGPTAPPRFARHTSVAIGTKVYVFGGFDGSGIYFDLSIFDTEDNRWHTACVGGKPPRSRTNHAAAAIGHKLYIHGGINRDTHWALQDLDEFYVYSTITGYWSEVKCTGDKPTARCGHRMVAIGNKLYMFGGGAGDSWRERYNDIHIFDTETNAWRRVPPNPIVRVCTFSSVFVFGNLIGVYGGQHLIKGKVTKKIYFFDTISETWIKQSFKPNSINNQNNSNNSNNNTSTLSASSLFSSNHNNHHHIGNMENRNSGPNTNSLINPRDMASADVVGDKVYLFGGYDGKAMDDLNIITLSSEIKNLQYFKRRVF
ncbi:hypothetical protein DFA_06675 [Cavenderia fasciculata]|uniref:F-box domain-containing protein n=1 Tax=Cavenderia fasciculata TaxID=261658 RepID=F4Q1Y9_CACFS|nr:uncharacterized protein DFA_06675 [Cavenderia fasciculata]EGG18009.1 hypothetical protein DFA_06675 [Cavenderia fasciculata]|eukprot:XP_004356902.1 hypothetical protein DFA_06675 [Cavenderia fasciculata]